MTLIRREADGGDAPLACTTADIEAWLLHAALRQIDLLALFLQFLSRLVASGCPLDRASLHVGTLHPQLLGYAWNWSRADGFCDEVKVDELALTTDAYRRNPLSRVIEHGETVRARLDGPNPNEPAPLLAELARQGFTEYAAIPLNAGGAYHNAATVATRSPGGFPADQIESLTRLLRLLALHVERHIAIRIGANALETYLGTAAGARVLQGSIKRGEGEPIRAIVWVSDLRGFTNLADRLAGNQMIALLNAYFERLAGAVLANGGEVLKFIGDGLLAVFPFAAFESERAAASAALAAAEAALDELARFNDDPEQLTGIEGWQPLRTGVALHLGEVFFGNVGAPERLDFTVIGRAVNTASRVEGLSKSLGRPILITGPVALLLDRPLDDLGAHQLRGVAEPIPIFAPKRV